MRVLLVEDNADLAANVADYLAMRGHAVDYAADGAAGLSLCTTGEYDALVLDVMLPRMDGLDMCRRLRAGASGDLPVLMLTARDTVDDRVAGLESGADDYLVKPFALRELEARLRALVRRRRAAGSQRVVSAADLSMDLDTLTVTRAGRAIALTPIELRLLEALLRAAPAVVSRAALEHALWGDAPPESGVLRLHVHGLRAAIDKPFARPLLRTVRGRGYAIDPGDEPAA